MLLQLILTLGYYHGMTTDVNKAARLMGLASAAAREKAWGRKEFVLRMRKWGRIGGRPKGSGKKQKRG
jgi:hypothetical protein